MILITLFIIFIELNRKRRHIGHSFPIFTEITHLHLIIVSCSHSWYRFPSSSCNKLGQISTIIFSKIKSLFITKEIFLIMIFQSEACRCTSWREPKLINYFLPHFIMRYSLPASFFTHRFIEFMQVELFPSNLRDFDLCYSFGCPVFLQMLFESICLF